MAVGVAEHPTDCECARCVMADWATTLDEPPEGATLDPSQRARLALMADLLAAYSRSARGRPVPTDDDLAELALALVRAGPTKRGRTLAVQLAGAALARAIALHEAPSVP